MFCEQIDVYHLQINSEAPKRGDEKQNKTSSLKRSWKYGNMPDSENIFLYNYYKSA